MMATDFDTIWRQQDEPTSEARAESSLLELCLARRRKTKGQIRVVVNANLGECIWHLGYSQERQAIELELTLHIEEYTANDLCAQFPLTADHDGEGHHGTIFVFCQS